MFVGTVLGEHCSPTLASLKRPISFLIPIRRRICCYVESCHQQHFPKRGIGKGAAQEESCGAHLCLPAAQIATRSKSSDTIAFLKNYGYHNFSVRDAIGQLQARFEQSEFPHEIGLFLGYPLGDVVGFIQNAGKKQQVCRMLESILR